MGHKWGLKVDLNQERGQNKRTQDGDNGDSHGYIEPVFFLFGWNFPAEEKESIEAGEKGIHQSPKGDKVGCVWGEQHGDDILHSSCQKGIDWASDGSHNGIYNKAEANNQLIGNDGDLKLIDHIG